MRTCTKREAADKATSIGTTASAEEPSAPDRNAAAATIEYSTTPAMPALRQDRELGLRIRHGVADVDEVANRIVAPEPTSDGPRLGGSWMGVAFDLLKPCQGVVTAPQGHHHWSCDEEPVDKLGTSGVLRVAQTVEVVNGPLVVDCQKPLGNLEPGTAQHQRIERLRLPGKDGIRRVGHEGGRPPIDTHLEHPRTNVPVGVSPSKTATSLSGWRPCRTHASIHFLAVKAAKQASTAPWPRSARLAAAISSMRLSGLSMSPSLYMPSTSVSTTTKSACSHPPAALAALEKQHQLLSAAGRQLLEACDQVASQLRGTDLPTYHPHSNLRTLLACSGQPFAIYLTSNLLPAVSLRRGPTSRKIVICSIPKAGTYLYARLLQLLGVESTRLHLWLTYFDDFRSKSVDQSFLAAQEDVRIHLPFNDSVNLVHPGQFAVSHLPCSVEVVDLLRDFKVIFLYRDLRDAAASHMRFVSKSSWRHPEKERQTGMAWRALPDGPEKMSRYLDEVGTFFFDDRCRPAAGWIDRDEVLKLSFEQINGDYGREKQLEAIELVWAFCEIEGKAPDAEGLLKDLIGSQTETYSGKRTKWRNFWDEGVEQKFCDLVGQDINRRFGFEEVGLEIKR